ncbi:Flp family type IVb pilin [uncultured Nocardioides sp.]|uniref:Flp family type IVb pilin n=1 Tax=uncultured Nocardioides sp. TaxID=198441 RepID=UPI002632087F|nr:Flp family type IVb pilin [uncultured Nocardioides sp.]
MDLYSRFAPRSHGDRGATAVEYALLVSLIAAVIASVVALVGGSLLTIFNDTLTWPW